ncbi:MAG: hypothetical protein KDK96_00680 [Chlamydiia bacterium]|nr:hypothetical protein [Chlamydiia bacterium]
MRFIEPGSRDADGFNDDETEAFRDMHQTRLQLNAKFGCLGYTLFIIGLIIVYIIGSFL